MSPSDIWADGPGLLDPENKAVSIESNIFNMPKE
jgi:hypothetical protein